MSGDVNVKYMQLRSSSIVVYNKRYSRSNKETVKKYDLHSDTSKPTYSGVVTANVKRRIRRAVQVLTQISEWQTGHNPVTNAPIRFKLNFITLTISTQERLLSGKESYQLLLKPFIQSMQRNHGMRSYIWKAELQANGQLHYHITTNTFINFETIKKRWNALQKKAGLLDGYHAVNGHYNPNSTDVHKVYNDDNIEAYLEKYISKPQELSPLLKQVLGTNELVDSEACLGSIISCNQTCLLPNVSVHGKVWDCSADLKSTKLFSCELLPVNETAIIALDKKEACSSFSSDFFEIIYFKSPSISKLLYGFQHRLYTEWKLKVLNYKRTRSQKRRFRQKHAFGVQSRFEFEQPSTVTPQPLPLFHKKTPAP